MSKLVQKISKLSENLKALMWEVGITVTELARQTGVGQPVIHRMASGETDNPKVGSLRPIAKFLNVTISELLGDAPLPEERFKGSHNPYYRSWSKLPLLSWEQAAVWPERKLPSEIESYISTEAIVSEKAFAVKMEDSTMLPRFSEGSILVIEPTIMPRNNDFAAVVVGNESKMQFKQALYDSEDLYLKPLNPDFQIRNVGKNYRILGTMIQALIEYYQTRTPQEQIQYLSNKPPVKKRREERLSETAGV